VENPFAGSAWVGTLSCAHLVAFVRCESQNILQSAFAPSVIFYEKKALHNFWKWVLNNYYMKPIIALAAVAVCLAGNLSAQTLSNYQFVVSSQGPGTYFKLDNSLASSVDPSVVLEQNLATGGGFTFDVFGNTIKSYFFANQTDFLRTSGTNIISGGGVSNTVSTATGSITFLFRTLSPGTNVGQRYVFSGGGVTEDHNALAMFLENTNSANGDPNSYKLRFGDTTTTILQASNVVANTWYYFALIYNESSANVNKAKWYIGRAGDVLTNGVMTNAADAVAGYGQAPFVIGSHTNFNSGFRNPGNGRVDEFAVWNRELTAAEITNQFVALPVLPSGVMVTNVIVNDSFADANRTNTGPLQADWWSSSSTTGNSVEVYTNQLGLISGSSGRGLHGTFAPQTLGIGDTITATYTFTTPTNVGATSPSSAFKIALMTFTNAALAADLTSSSTFTNQVYTNLPGYMTDFDVNEVSTSNITLRKHQTTNTASGRFLGTTAEWNTLGNSAAIGYTFISNTVYVGVIAITRTGVNSVKIFSSMSQGATLLGSHSETDEGDIANNIGMLGFWANTLAFGTNTTAGEFQNNGITFSNIKVEVATFSTAAPTLKIVLSGSDVVLSWPASTASSYALESTNALSSATNNWPSAGTATIVGNNYVVTNALSAGNLFYRLRKP
jgi:hypothetical protein